MVHLAIWIVAFVVICAFIGAGLGLLLRLLQVVLMFPYGFYIGLNRYRLKQAGFNVDSDDLPGFGELLRFYARALTFRRPLLP